MSEHLAGRRNRGRGQALVEFALIAPFLFLLIIAIIEIGRFVFIYHVVNEATREGSRYAIVHGENAWDGCPSGPVPFGETPCDTPGDNIRARIIEAATGLNTSTCADDLDIDCIKFGWPGDSAWPLYGPADGSDPFNRQNNDVTIHVEYRYSPILLLDLMGPVNLRAESTLVINN